MAAWLVGRREGVPAARLEGGWGGAAHILSMVSIRGRVGSWGFGAVDLKDHAYQVCCFILIGEEPGLKPIMAG